MKITNENLGEETITVVDEKGIFEWTFKRTALKNFDVTLKPPTWEELYQNKFQEYLHNMNGPAVRAIGGPAAGQFEQYYINGKLLSDEETEKMKHDLKFHKKLDDVIDG